MPFKLEHVTIASPGFKGFKKYDSSSSSYTISATFSSIVLSTFSHVQIKVLPLSKGAFDEFFAVASSLYLLSSLSSKASISS